MALSRLPGLSTLLLAGAALSSCHARSAPVAAALPAPAPTVAAPQPWPTVAPHADATLLPRKLLFSAVARSQVKISPDGKHIGWLAPVQGALNVWVAPSDDVKKAQPVTQSTSGEIRTWWWTFGSDRILFLDDKSDGSSRLFAVDLAKNETKDLTPVDGVHAELLDLSPKRPREALVALNERDKKVRDVCLVDLVTGVRKVVQPNDGGFEGWVTDDDLRVRFATRRNADASVDFLQPTPGKEKWKPFQHVGLEDTLALEPVAFDKSGNNLYLKDSRNRDTSGLFAVDTKTGTPTLLASDPRADAGPVLLHPTSKTIEAVSFDYDRPTWKVVDASVEADFYYLQTFGDGTLLVTSRSLDEQHWVVAYTHSDGPTHYYRYDRDTDIPGNPGTATFLFTAQEDLERAKLSPMNPVVIKARDGLDLVSYLTLPNSQDPRGEGRPEQPLPTVVWVHDGPWTRASLEYSPEHQWLASRGYAVLSVNYRGSSGFGQKFRDAGDQEWGGKMSDDLVDAVRWAVDQKIADPSKVAIVGAGYGGYAALVGLENSPDTFACGVDFGGPSNLVTFVPAASPEAPLEVEALARRVGDWRTEDGKKFLARRSPVTRLEAIKGPLLIGQGKDDARVLEPETTAFVAALKAKRIPVTYSIYADEEGDLEAPANRRSFAALTEVFLAQCLGGSYEPIGDDFAGSTMTVPVGAGHLYGVTTALNSKK